MRERNYPVQIYLNQKEYAALCRHVSKSGLSKSSYIRSLLNGYTPKEMPGADFFALMREIHAVGNRMNQIAAKANAVGLIDADIYTANALKLRETTQKIYEAVMLPERMERN